MILTILFWVAMWLLIGLATQLLNRIISSSKIFAGPEYYFWSALAGPVVTLIFILMPVIEWYIDKTPGGRL